MTGSEQKELQLLDKASREFARKMLAPEREENDKYPFGPFFQHVLDKAFELDFFHLMLPEDAGGTGHGIDALCVILDNICREDSSLGGILFTSTLAQQIFLAADEKARLIQIVGEADTPAAFLIAFQALNNPGETRQLPIASQNRGKYSLSGTADYLVLGNIADQALIPARLGDGRGYSFFLVSTSAGGVTLSEPVVSHGLHGCPAVDMEMESTPGTLVGSEGEGAACFKKAADVMQLAAAAMSSGIMKGAVKEAFAYCSERVQGGRKIKDWSALQMILSDMAVKSRVADLLVSQACRAVKNGDKGWEVSAQAVSIHVQDTAADLAPDGIQALGGVGYMKDFGQEKRFRDIGQVNAFLGIGPMKKLNFVRQLLAG